MPTNELWVIERRTRPGKAYAWGEWVRQKTPFRYSWLWAWETDPEATANRMSYWPEDTAQRQYRVNRYTPDKAWHGSM